MTDRTDVDSPSHDEPSKPGTGDEVVWPVWGAGTGRPALSDETRRIPVVADRTASEEPSDSPADVADEPSAGEPPAAAPAPAEPTRESTPEQDPADSGELPSGDAPSGDAPAGEPEATAEPSDEATAEPATHEPAADEAATDEAAADEPVTDEPAAHEPATDEPVTDEAPADEPGTDEPAADEPVTDEAPADEPVTDESAADEPVTDEAPADEPATDEPATDEAPADDRARDEAAADDPATDQAVADEPATEETAADEAATGEAAADEPATDEAAADEPATDEAAAQGPDSPEGVVGQARADSASPEVVAAGEAEATGATDTEPSGDVVDPRAGSLPATDESSSTTSADLVEPSATGAAEAGRGTDEASAAGKPADETVVVPPAVDQTVVLAPLPDDAALAAREAAGAQQVGTGPVRESVLPGRTIPPLAPGPEQTTGQPAQPSPLPPVPAALAGTSRVSAGAVPQAPRDPSPFDEFEPEERTRRWPRRLLVGAGLLVVLGGAYVGASYATADRVPRGTTVAGVDIGGLSADDAVARLDEELAATTGTAIAVQANDVQASIDPSAAGLSFDAQATVDQLTGVDLTDPLRLWHQIAGRGEAAPVTQVDEAKLDDALEALGSSLSLAPVDGAVLFVDGGAVLTDAADGWALDEDAAAEVVADDWLVAAQPLALPTEVVEPAITQAAAQAALDDVAEPLVSAPISVTVADKLAVLQPATLAAAASMQPQDGELVLQLDGEALAQEVVKQLPEGVLTSASDARFEFKDDKPVLVPGEPGTTVAPDDVATAVAGVANAQNRTAVVELSQTDPAETTEAMEKLGVKEIVSEFSTPLTSEPRRTKNIAQGLANITGVLIRPGETFSLTEALGPIDAAHGFVQAGAIVNGEHSDAWGGGLSQVSTTTYNAAYLAGMEDVEHTPHSEWFSRYPEGREATIFTGSIDMKWKNTTPYGALMQGWVSGGRAYVRIWGTKYWTVESTTSGRSGVVQPSTVYSDSRTCTPQSAGNPGFSVTVTRKLYLDGELKETTSNSWRYKPQNRVVCGSPPSKDDDED